MAGGKPSNEQEVLRTPGTENSRTMNLAADESAESALAALLTTHDFTIQDPELPDLLNTELSRAPGLSLRSSKLGSKLNL